MMALPKFLQKNEKTRYGKWSKIECLCYEADTLLQIMKIECIFYLEYPKNNDDNDSWSHAARSR